MKDVIFDDFQNAVDESLLRHRSIIDILTKLEESQSRINRAVAKSITNCGCIHCELKKIDLPKDTDDIDVDIKEIKNCTKNTIKGKLCDDCREVIEKEIGNNLFYLASLCNTLDLNLYDILLKEYDRTNILGKFSLR